MLKVGFSRLDITPPLGTDISGYFVRRIADGMLDPLYVNTVAVNNGDDTVILMAADYIGVKLPVIKKIKALISERTGVAEDAVFFSALHQHTAPCLEGTENPRSTALKDPIFMDVVIRKFADAAKMAVDDLKDATMSTVTTEVAEPISFVRRYFTEDGTVKSNPNTDKYKIVAHCAEADNSVRLVRFDREGANSVALINFSTHPDVIAGNKWSADWPGFTRRFVEEALEGVSAIFFTGTQGDSNHIDYFKPKSERIKGGKGYTHSQYMGRMVADAVISAWDKTEAVSEDNVSYEYRVIYNRTNLEGLEDYDDAVAFDKEYQEKSTQSNWGNLGIVHGNVTSIAYARRIISLKSASIFRPVPLTVVTIGKLILFGFGGEAFTSYSRILKELVPDKYVMTAVNTNGYEGYFPTAEAFAQGGYEAVSSLYTPDLEAQIVEAVEDMLKNAK